MILKVIGEQRIIDESRTETNTISNLFGVADFQFVRPSLWWNDNITYFAATEENTVSNNKIQSYTYNHITKRFFNTTVGSGTTVQDSFNHPRAFIWYEGDYLYTGQSNPHNGVIDIFKSDVQIENDGGFSSITGVSGSNSYPKIFTTKDNKACICIRTGSSAPNFDLAVNLSSAGIEGTFTQIKITANTVNDFRFYNESPVLYGTQTKHYLVGNVRSQTNSQYFTQVLLVTYDFNTYYNYEETFSKNVVSTSEITNAEISSNFLINGDFSTVTDTSGYMMTIQVDDVFYGVCEKEGTSDHYIFKVENKVLTETLVTIPNFDRNKYLYYNGNNILITCRVDEGGGVIKNKIYGSPLDLSSFTEVFSVDADSGQPILNLPENLDTVIGEYAIPISITGNDLDIYLTSDKFFV